jgi:hypothetical protein
MVIKEHWM